MRKVNLNGEQKRDLLTISERLELLEEAIVLLESDNKHLRQRLDEAQAANYQVETNLHCAQEKVLFLEAQKFLMKFELRSLGDTVRCAQRIAIKALSTADNIERLMRKIEGSD